MTTYYTQTVNLSTGQKQSLAQAFNKREALTIRLAHNQLQDSDELNLTKTHIKRIKKAQMKGTGTDLKISKAQMRKVIKYGGSLFTSIMPLLKSIAPTLAKTIGLSALSGLASEGASQVVKKMTGGFIIPQNKIDQLISSSKSSLQ